MTKIEGIALVVTIISLLCFSAVFTILFSSYCKTSSLEVLSGKKDIELLDTVLIEKKEKEKSKKKPNRILKITKKIISYAILLILGVTLISSFYSKVTGDMTPVFDTTVLTIKTGSMSKKHESNDYLYTNDLNDQFQAFDMIFIREVSQEELDEYVVIAFRNETNTIIVHRIVEVIENEESGVIKYRTRGDANNAYDTYMPTYEDVIGIYEGKRIPILGIFILFLQSYSGMVTILAVVYCIWMFNKQFGKFKSSCDERINILLSLIKDPVDINDFKTSYVQYIYYQGNIYEFVDGSFIRKGSAASNSDSNIYIVKGEKESPIIEAKNVSENKVVELTQEEKDNTLNDIKNKIKE